MPCAKFVIKFSCGISEQNPRFAQALLGKYFGRQTHTLRASIGIAGRSRAGDRGPLGFWPISEARRSLSDNW